MTPLPRKKKGVARLPLPIASSSTTGHYRYSGRTTKPHHCDVGNHAAIGVVARRRWRHFHGGERTTLPCVVGTTTDLQRKPDQNQASPRCSKRKEKTTLWPQVPLQPRQKTTFCLASICLNSKTEAELQK